MRGRMAAAFRLMIQLGEAVVQATIGGDFGPCHSGRSPGQGYSSREIAFNLGCPVLARFWLGRGRHILTYHPSLTRFSDLSLSFFPRKNTLCFVLLTRTPARQNATIVVYVCPRIPLPTRLRSEEHTSELQSLRHLVCRLL